MYINTKYFFEFIKKIFLFLSLQKQLDWCKLLFMKKVMKKTVFVFVTLGALVCATGKLFAADEFKVVDGDSLEQGSVRIRLIDIDAPELFQECYDENDNKYRCGKKALDQLEMLVGNVDFCKEAGVDKYKRKLMECFDKNGVSINKLMVLNGWAVSYGNKFEKEENKAKKQKSGIWNGRFMRPELYRALHKN